MRKRFLATAALMFTMGCRTETEFGQCIGVQDDRSPMLVYEVPTRNIVLSAIFFQSVIGPALFFFADFRCPVARKQEPR